MLFTHIRQLLQVREADCMLVRGADMAHLPLIEHAFLRTENGKISSFGPMALCPAPAPDEEVVDCTGKILMPGWCDSHTHVVYAGNRSGEFVDRIKGHTYAEIAAKGGGILNSAQKLNQTSEDALYAQAVPRVEELIRQGTVALEIKSGYGLTTEGELKMLRVIRRLRDNYPLAIKATFLGAHAYPMAYKSQPEAYVDLIINEMMPRIAQEGLADYVDAFLETGYFSTEATLRIIEAARTYGWPAKLHVNQFTASGGVAACVVQNARSVDHLEVVTPDDIAALQKGQTLPVALPGCSFFIQIPYTPARQLLEAGLPLVLASDYNPGTCPSGNMSFMVALACIQMHMTPEEAINAATLNGAAAMDVADELGSITIGKRAHLLLTQPLQSYAEIPYRFGSQLIQKVYLDGQLWCRP